MFRNDYSEIAAPEVLNALSACGLEQNVGYGLDKHSQRAEELILKRFGLDKNEASVHFLAGGTQTNAVVISFFLRPYEGIIACDSGHINGHETGAVEGTGHKIVTCRAHDGKLLPADIEKAVLEHDSEHLVKLKMVYISDSTESGTVYTADEIYAIRKVCDKYGLILFLDGARLGSALTCGAGGVDAELIGRLCDVFYVGGTKNGLLFGEAVVIKNRLCADDFRYHIKNRGAMLAKGFVLGVQFEALFEDDLYFRLASHSNEMADIVRKGLNELGIQLVGTSPTNQIFLQVDKDFADVLTDRYGLELWTDLGREKVIRLVTSFATQADDCREFVEFVRLNK